MNEFKGSLLQLPWRARHFEYRALTCRESDPAAARSTPHVNLFCGGLSHFS